MRRLTRNVHWNGENKTLYVRRRSSGRDLPKLIEQYRRTLELTPDDAGTRFMLAGCLYGAGQVEEAKAEWEAVRQSGGEEWAQTVTETLSALPEAPS